MAPQVKAKSIRRKPLKLYMGRWKPPFDGKKLTWKQVDEIKELCGYMTDKELAQAYGVSSVTIYYIRNEETWQWV